MANEQQIDTMSTEDLNSALASELNQLDGKESAEPETKPEPVAEPKTGEVPVEGDKTGEEGEVDGDGNPYRKRIDRLLRKRDTLEETVAQRDQRIAALEAENTALKAKPTQDEEEPTQKVEDIASTINKVLDERESKNKTVSEKQKIMDTEFDSLVKKFPNATTRKSEVLELANKYPDLTFEAIDRIIAPEDHIDPIEVNRKNAKRMDVTPRSRGDLEQEVDLTKASTKDIEKHLKGEIASGRLSI